MSSTKEKQKWRFCQKCGCSLDIYYHVGNEYFTSEVFPFPKERKYCDGCLIK